MAQSRCGMRLASGGTSVFLENGHNSSIFSYIASSRRKAGLLLDVLHVLLNAMLQLDQFDAAV